MKPRKPVDSLLKTDPVAEEMVCLVAMALSRRVAGLVPSPAEAADDARLLEYLDRATPIR